MVESFCTLKNSWSLQPRMLTCEPELQLTEALLALLYLRNLSQSGRSQSGGSGIVFRRKMRMLTLQNV